MTQKNTKAKYYSIAEVDGDEKTISIYAPDNRYMLSIHIPFNADLAWAVDRQIAVKLIVKALNAYPKK